MKVFKRSRKDIFKKVQSILKESGKDYSPKIYLDFIEKCFKEKLVFSLFYSPECSTIPVYTHVAKFVNILQIIQNYNLLEEYFYGSTVLRKSYVWVECCFELQYKGMAKGMWLSIHRDHRFDLITVQQFNTLLEKYSNTSLKYLI